METETIHDEKYPKINVINKTNRNLKTVLDIDFFNNFKNQKYQTCFTLFVDDDKLLRNRLDPTHQPFKLLNSIELVFVEHHFPDKPPGFLIIEKDSESDQKNLYFVEDETFLVDIVDAELVDVHTQTSRRFTEKNFSNPTYFLLYDDSV